MMFYSKRNAKQATDASSNTKDGVNCKNLSQLSKIIDMDAAEYNERCVCEAVMKPAVCHTLR